MPCLFTSHSLARTFHSLRSQLQILRWHSPRHRFTRYQRNIHSGSSGEALFSDADLSSAATSWTPRGCFIIAGILSSFIALSLCVGIFVMRQGSYRMGDSFMLAGYVVAVGALVCSFLFACHLPHCRCWQNRDIVSRWWHGLHN